MKEIHQKCFAEFIGTFALVLAGTGSMIVNDVHQGVVSHVGVGLVWGMIVMVMIYSVGDISGAHLNPAVTFGFWLLKLFPGKEIIPYFVSQCLGAISASAVLKFIFPTHSTLGGTFPHVGVYQTLILEILLTFFLMFVIIHVSEGSKEKGLMAGVAIGSLIGLEALWAGPLTNASMNPARSLGPALVSGNLTHLWIYIVATFVGVILATFTCKILRGTNCCKGNC